MHLCANFQNNTGLMVVDEDGWMDGRLNNMG